MIKYKNDLEITDVTLDSDHRSMKQQIGYPYNALEETFANLT